MANRPMQGTKTDYWRNISLEYSYMDLMEATKNWSMDRRLGAGAFGAVYKGEMEDGSEVAIKMIDLAGSASPELSGFQEEVETLSKFRHPNLVTLMGWGKHQNLRYLIYECLVGGDVFQRMLKAHSPPAQWGPFIWHERLSAILDAATGLSHLHNVKPQAFHRDIKSANILLDKHGTAKMADFGLSCVSSGRRGHSSVTVTNISGTPGYACPIYSRTGVVTQGSEVYSFGMVILELLTNLAPAAADPARHGGIIYPVANNVAPNQPGALDRVVRCIDTQADWPPPVIQELGTLALRSADALDESKRPRFVEVVRAARAMIEKYKTAPQQAAYASLAAGSPRIGGGGHPVGVASPHGASTGGGAREARGVGFAPGVSSPSGEGGGGFVGQRARARSEPGGPSGAPIGAPGPYLLELVSASGVDAASLPQDMLRLQLAPTRDDGATLASEVGRQSFPDHFETWLPDLQFRTCVSRVAFEISWQPAGDGAWLEMKGANPVTVGGRILNKGDKVPLRVGSEIGFPYSAELSVFLSLRFSLASRHRARTEVQDRIGGGARWCLACVYAENVSPQDLVALPADMRDFLAADGNSLLVGRQHQPQAFEALLARSPACLGLISRTHVMVEATVDGYKATNMSSNPVYIDKERLAKGQAAAISTSRSLGFVRQEGEAHHSIFLSFQVREAKECVFDDVTHQL